MPIDTAVVLHPPKASRKRRLLAVVAAGALGLGLAAVAAPASADPVPQGASSQVGASNSFSPQVRHTAKKPTGYTVTFRYRDPSATRVQIKGEWYFSDPAQTSGTSSQGVLPQNWKPGDVPIAYPNATAANWPVFDLTAGKNGVWSITVPLPSGVFTYGFFVDCADDAGTGCSEVSDPANPPWNDVNGVSDGSVEPTSQVYVPGDPDFGTVDYSWQSPSDTHGNLVDVSYPDPLSVTPAGTHPLAVYTPPGYDPFRKQPYPTLYLSHGGGGQEVDWSTQGVSGNILDNLISSGQVQPTVVVMTNFYGLPDTANATYSQDVLNNVIPYVEANYNVSSSPAKRAFAGLSAGGQRGNDLLFNHTNQFGAYDIMSTGGGLPTTALSSAQKRALRRVDIHVGGGLQDPIRDRTLTEYALLDQAKVPFTQDDIDGGHEWYVWRILLHDFVLDSFLATTPGK